MAATKQDEVNNLASAGGRPTHFWTTEKFTVYAMLLEILLVYCYPTCLSIKIQ